jgi:hypothetical protein
LEFQIAKALQLDDIFLKLLSGELFKDGFLDEKAVFNSPLPTIVLGAFGDGIVHFHG